MQIERILSMTLARLSVTHIDASLHAVAELLARPGTDLVIVCDELDQMAGVLSKSDLVRQMIYPNPNTISIDGLMTKNVISCRPEDDLFKVWDIMTERRLQNVPVLGSGNRAVGVLDVRDAFKVLFEHERFQEQMLANYIAGIGYL